MGVTVPQSAAGVAGAISRWEGSHPREAIMESGMGQLA